MSKKFVPKVLLLGTEEDLPEFSIDYEIIGKLKFDLTILDMTDGFFNFRVDIFFNEELISAEEFYQLKFDYILCPIKEFESWFHGKWAHELVNGRTFALTSYFRDYVSNVGYICQKNVDQLTKILNELAPKNILDFDQYFHRGGYFDCILNVKVETIIDGDFEPIFYNVYDRIFKNFDEMKLRSYGLIFFTADRTVDEWLEVLNWAMQSTRKIVAYVHEDSEAFEPLKNLAVDEAKIEYISATRGMWIVIESNRQETARIYVVYHEPYYFPKFPEGYIKIQAGRKNSTIDLGSDFLRDDIGDNISDLNFYLNELTTYYWIWKHIRTDCIGFSHYHRYFVIPDSESMPDEKNYVPIGNNNEHLMTIPEAMNILQDCDVIIRDVWHRNVPFQNDRLAEDPNSERHICYEIFRRHLSEKYPEYIPVLQKHESGLTFIANTAMFTRWKIFDAYCRWMFSFMIPATREIAEMYSNREPSYLAEEAFHIYAMHNNLRIKYVHMLMGNYDSTEETFDPKNFY